MHRPILAALRVAPLLLLAQIAAAGNPKALDEAHRLLDRNEARAAAEILEAALPTAASDRPALLQLLRQAYESAARQAEAAGKPRDAEQFRDNLAILNRKSSIKANPPADETLQRASNEAIKQAESSPTRAPAETPPDKVEAPNLLSPAEPAERVEPSPLSSPPSAPTSPASPAPKPIDGPGPGDVAEADAAFLAKTYDVAGRIYAALDREHRLPAQRRDHWAYCRWVDLVRRINANPTTAQEWASIDAEIKSVHKLSPNNWYGEYLRNCVAERSRGARRPPSDQLVLRGSSPEEPIVDKPGAIKAAPPRRPQGSPASPPAQPRQAAGSEDGAPLPIGDWQVHETTSFRIHHLDPALAERVAAAAESARTAQSNRWAGAVPRGAWSPKCDIYLYPSAKAFSKMTGQPEESPGFSTMGLNAGEIVARRINLRADHPNLQAAVLPHEITHVILADLFPSQQIPRWADEGMAVLAEPSSEQKARASDLGGPLAANRLFKINDLMVMDYPDGKHWALYYAQSVSLTRFLVDLEGPARFIDFVRASQRNGPEAELRRVYKIDSFADLQARWLAYAKAESSTLTASAPDTVDGSVPRTR